MKGSNKGSKQSRNSGDKFMMIIVSKIKVSSDEIW